MKKLFTVLCTLAVACAMAMPVYAKKGGKKSEESAASTTSKGKAHTMHAKKKGATEGKKKGQ